MLDIRVVYACSLDELDRHAIAWDELAVAAPEQLPMLSHAWVASFLEYSPSISRWHCFFAYQEDRLVGVLPIMSIGDRLPGVRFSGTLGAQLHTYSAYPLLAEATATAALSAMLAELRALEPHYLWLQLNGVRSDAAIRSIERIEGVRLNSVETPGWRKSGSILRTQGTFEDYLGTLSPNFRRNLRKARRRCERDHELEFQFVTGPDAGSREWLDTFLRLESSGWKGRAGTSIVGSPILAGFYAALCSRMSQRGWLEWHVLVLDGAPVAGHLAIRFGSSLVLLKIAYDEAQARLGPGSLLFHETAVRAFASEELQEINCLSDTPWHRNWSMSRAQYSDIVITRSGVVPTVAGLVEVRGVALARRTLSGAIRTAREHVGSASIPVVRPRGR